MAAVARVHHGVGAARVSALVAGVGDPVVLLHGIPTGAELWRDVLGLLADAGLHALAPDLPGYGQTRLPRGGDHSLRGAAALVAAWLRSIGVQPAWVVGHDAGGAVAQLLALHHRPTVARVTLANSIAHGHWPAPRAWVSTVAARCRLYRPAAALGVVPNPYMRRQVRRGFADAGASEAHDEERVLWDAKVHDRAGRAAFERHLAALTPRDTAPLVTGLPQLDVPWQLVWGMADPYQPWRRVGRHLEQLLAPASVVQLSCCGHFTPLECPRRLVEAMLSWRDAEER